MAEDTTTYVYIAEKKGTSPIVRQRTGRTDLSKDLKLMERQGFEITGLTTIEDGHNNSYKVGGVMSAYGAYARGEINLGKTKERVNAIITEGRE